MHPLQSKEIIQIGVVVRDLDAALDKYVKLFGLTERPGIRTVFPTINYRGKSIVSKSRLSGFRMGAITLELIEPDEGPSSWREFLDEHGEGVHHVGIVVDDRNEALATLAAEGIEPRQFGGASWGSYTITDSKALGVLFSVKCNAPFAMQ
ncbi:MAG: VOC family protein [Oscillospiraceae bacterium]|jgi:catechol 2,3-dioxygenase-like lactoylglutathione lyase family enzyme|nr:VOC family protein [Oscillospiraceae bacterium]